MFARRIAHLLSAAALTAAAFAQSAAPQPTTPPASPPQATAQQPPQTPPPKPAADDANRPDPRLKSAIAENARERVTLPRETRVVTLSQSNAFEIAGVVRDALGRSDAVRLTPDPRTNALILTADTGEALDAALKLIDAIDKPVPDDKSESVLSVPISAADAHSIGEALRSLYSGDANRVPNRSSSGGLRVVTVRSGGTVWLAGPTTLVQKYAQVAREMDAGAARATVESGELRYYELTSAAAEPLAATISATLRVLGLDASIVADGLSQTLIVSATPAHHERIAQLVKKLDVPPKPRPHVRTPAPDGEPVSKSDAGTKKPG